MAVGSIVNNIVSVAASSFLDIQPPSGSEWVIHNIYHAFDVTVEYYDGTNELQFDTDTGAGVYGKFAFHCTNARRIRVKNNSASTAYLIGYDGVQTL
jgi:hypothetical protein